MSTETSELNQPKDGDSGEPRRRFGFLHADTGVDDDGVDEAVATTDVDDDVVDPSDAFTGTVYDSTPSAGNTATTLPDPREPVFPHHTRLP